MIWFLLFLLVVAGLAAAAFVWPFHQENLRREPDPATAAGRFADLPSGRTHYLWAGAVRGPVAVCIHGLTTPLEVWTEAVPELGALTHKVLLYDLYGRGHSATVAGPQDAAFFIRQLEELLADQGVSEDITLIGYSMGGAIATAFAAKNPHMIQRVILVAPAGVELAEPAPRERQIRAYPLLWTWLFNLLEPIRQKRRLEAEAETVGRAFPDIHAARLAQLDRKGYFPAILSSMRGLLSQRLEKEHRRLGRDGIPVIAIWGEDDDVIPIRSVGTLAQWNREARQEVVKGAGHDLVYARAEDLAAIYRSILREDA